MVEIYGKRIGKEVLQRSIGSMAQVCGIELLKFVDGIGKGVRVALMRTGLLDLMIVVDRCLDIANAEYRGIPLAWISPTGITSPYIYETKGFEWLRGFFGGLLTTCGLTTFGRPSIDLGEELGLHGRISYTPARLRSIGGEWIGDEYIIWIEGEVREAKVFGPNLLLRRRIESNLGGRTIKISDEVVNEGCEEQPFMILYHFNMGYPILDEGARFILTSKFYAPMDKNALIDAENFDKIHGPVRGYKEKVYFHEMGSDEKGYVYAGIVNPNLLGGIGMRIRFRKSELNRFIQWRMLGEGTYVMGIEPCNAVGLGRDKERRWGTLQFIKPGERRRFELDAKVLVGRDEIDEFIERVNGITGGRRPRLLKTVEEFVEAIT